MDTYSSAESSKPQSTHKAYVLNELKEAKRALALKDEAMQKLEARLAIKDDVMQRLEERLAKVELKQERSSHSIHGRHHSPRHSSKGSSNAHDQHHHGHVLKSSNTYGSFEKKEEWKIHKLEDRRQHVALPYFQSVKVRSFIGDSDPNVYLDWEAKSEQTFKAYEIHEDQ